MNAMKPHALSRVHGARGVTLIELMVGLAIGMAVTVVVAQSMFFYESQKRTTTEGVDAQINGTLALNTLQREVQMAGYGFTTSALGLGCPIKARRNGVDVPFPLVPLTITNGADGAPDEISFVMSNKPFALPIRVAKDHPRTAANFFVSSSLGVAEGDLLVAVPKAFDVNNWCSLLQATKPGGGGGGGGAGIGQNQVLHDAGVDGPWNQPGGQTVFPDNGYPAGSFLLNLGQIIRKTYSIGNGNTLQVVNFSIDTATFGAPDTLYPHIVNLQALYGKDTDGNGSVDTWDNDTPIDGDATGWKRVIAVRVAIVARSGQYEKEDVTFAEPLWDVGVAHAVADASICGDSKCLTLKVDGLPDWQRYRYKVYETVVPLRNILWST
jgi:type IV pilus assembly protein PilW